MKKRMRADRALACVLAVIIFAANIRNIAILNGPYMFSDELGYLGHAAAFAGKDWGSVMQYCSWYGFGWSMVIAPLFALFSSMSVIYRCVNVLNAFLVVAVFFMLRFLLKRLFQAGNAVLLTVISACACFYPSILVHSSMAWAETWLLFVFMALSLVAWELIQRPKWYKACAFGALLWYFYVCHNRMIAVVIAGVLLVFALWATKAVRFRDVAAFIVSLFAAYLLFGKLKDFVVARNWPRGLPNDNNLSGGLERLTAGLTPEGAISLISVLCSQFLYVCVASCGMVPVGLYAAISKAVRCMRERRASEGAMEIWLSLSFLGIFAVSVIMVGGTDDLTGVRLDHVFYGRYCEPVYIALLAYGLAALSQRALQKEIPDFQAVCLLAAALCAWSAYGTTKALIEPVFNRPNAPGISAYYESFRSEYFVFFAAAFSMLVMNVLIKLLPCSKRRPYIALGCLCGVFVASGLSAGNTILESQAAHAPEVELMDTVAKYDVGDKTVYALGSMDSKYYQCMLPNLRLEYVKDGILSKLPGEQFFAIAPKADCFSHGFDADVEIIANSKENVFVSVDKSKPGNEMTVPLSMLHLMEISNMDAQGIHIQGTAGGLAFYGPYIDLSGGSYELTINMAIESESDRRTFGELLAVSTQVDGVIAETVLTREMVNQGTVHVVLPIHLEESAKQVEFYLNTAQDVTYEVYAMTLSKEYRTDYPLSEQSEQLSLGGFSNVEADGRWMEQNEAHVDCYLPADDYRMVVELGNRVPLELLDLDTYETKVYVNDFLMGDIAVTQDSEGEWIFSVPKECLENGDNEIRFSSGELWSPSEYGATDERELGLNINRISFEPDATLDGDYRMDYPLSEENPGFPIAGFTKVENVSRWMEQNEARIDCYLPDGDYVMTVQLGNRVPVEQLGLDAYEAEVYMNDVLLGKIELTQDAQSEWRFNVSKECLEDGDNMLALRCETLWTPSKYGSMDTRKLGLSITSVTFEPAGEYALEYDLSQDTGLALSGYSHAEAHGRWMDANRATIGCWLPKDDYTLSVKLGTLIPLNELHMRAFTVQVYVNDYPAGEIRLTPDMESDLFQYDIPASCLQDGSNNVSFTCESLWSPAAIGIEDERMLGASIESVTFTPAEE